MERILITTAFKTHQSEYPATLKLCLVNALSG